MTLIELLKNPLLDLPKNWQSSGERSYYHFIIRIGKEFLDLLDNLDNISIDGNELYMGQIPNVNFVRETAKCLYQAIIHSIRIYLDEGSPANAYNIFASNLEKRNNSSTLYMPDSYLSSFRLRNEVLYRIRNESTGKGEVTEASQMLHIPFQLRHIVPTQRFSISGYPSIYAANSIYLCHREIGNPIWDEHVFAAKLRSNPNSQMPLVLLDLRNQVNEMRAKKNADGSVMKFLTTWLLTMATSVPTAYTTSFKEEYILPQLVLQWVNNNNRTRGNWFSGIAYSSSKVPLSNPNFTGSFYNVVIPVHHALVSGLCEVRTKQLQVSDPININHLHEYNSQIDTAVKSIEESNSLVNYKESIYFKFESALNAKPFLNVT